MKLPSLVSVSSLAQALLKSNPLKPIAVIHSGLGTKRDFVERHLPGAVYFDIDECADLVSPYPHMLPSEKVFAEYVQYLGMLDAQTLIGFIKL